MKKLLYYIWELIPKQFMLDNFRYIINNYYKESNLKDFEESLNMNYKSYIQNKINEITFEEIKNLLSKFYY
jgi:polynucleotide 5'-kinase involved in rRNA processing